MPLAESNPFATRFVRPGALPFLFSRGESLATVRTRLFACGNWGEIVGPHGTGKSTLLAELLRALAEEGRKVVHFSLHDGQRRLPKGWRDAANRCGSSAQQHCDLIAVDGCEQLVRWSRWQLKRFCRRRGYGLLVTAHDSVGLPSLHRTAGTLETARQVVSRLMPDWENLFEPLDLAAAFDHHAGNVREMLFTLYDLYESRCRQLSGIAVRTRIAVDRVGAVAKIPSNVAVHGDFCV